MASAAEALIAAARRLRAETTRLRFGPPVTHVYNPLTYAWAPHEAYLRRFGTAPKRVVFLGMNPGPFGMAQTGVPFGEVSAVRDWLQLEGHVGQPSREHPRRPVTGFGCVRSEVSGRRLWGLFAARFGTPDRFFAGHIVMNYCPLAFLEATGRNRTPDKLPIGEQDALFAACDRHLRAVIGVLQPEWLIGIGEFAARRAEQVFGHSPLKIGRILHPSPASPAANRNWNALATRQLEAPGIWEQGPNGQGACRGDGSSRALTGRAI
ncbi:MAG TPA: single-stranded DNA-binding protein [Verrucomicrobiota bacterium]|nr:single-stranded DNA-binding protein [Verrucomicrobiota bacterium]HQL77679.1 single-stranded DNA-binding protein [Verrucomicrobiota bacterium]